MKIVLAFDSFKGSLSAREVCACVRDGMRSCRSDLEILACPMADGGEGTANVLMNACGGEWVACRVAGPLPTMQVDAGFAWLPHSQAAVVEMASASGLPLLKPVEYNPLVATTFGTGELIGAAVDQGARRIWLAVGGSATVDGGVGAAQALGWRFGADGKMLAPDKMNMPEVEVLCDVINPLCGPRGAARVYGPQKGATPEMVEALESRLCTLAESVSCQLGKSVADLPGAGAAGGLAFGAVAFLNGRLRSGIDAVMAETGFAKSLNGAQWVLTGEGCVDGQSLQGKVIDGVVRRALRVGTKIGVIAGDVRLPEADWRAQGVSFATALRRSSMSVADSICQCRNLLFDAAAAFAQDL